MEYTTLGRTGLKVSVAGLGCGGFSRLGLGTGKSEAHAIGIIRAALDLGVNLFDTAAAYGTEPVLGKALRGVPREQVVICTKAPFGISNPDATPEKARRQPRPLAEGARHRLHRRLPAARGRAARLSARAARSIAPALLREKEKGKFRHLGITETAPDDPHARNGAARLPRRGVGRRDDRVPHDAPERARQRLSADPPAPASARC